MSGYNDETRGLFDPSDFIQEIVALECLTNIFVCLSFLHRVLIILRFLFAWIL